MKRKIVLVAILIILSIGIFGVIGVSAEVYGDLTYSVISGDIEITGCLETATEIVIPAKIGDYTVTSIGKYAFQDCENLTSITIPDSIKNIKYLAFGGCVSLENITVPSGVINIGHNAFAGCTGLKNISIPDSVESIGEKILYNCPELEEITLPFIGKERGNSGTKESVFCYLFGPVPGSEYSYTILKTMDVVKQKYASTSYVTYYIPKLLKKVTVTDEYFIGYGAFYGCTNILDIILDCEVKAVGSYAFAEHYNLLNITFKSLSPKFADSMVFYNTDFATLYGYPDSTVEEYATKNGIDFEPLVLSGHCEINGSIKAINNTLVVNVELNALVTDECLHIVLYKDDGQMVDYIIVPSDKPFNSMNVVFKDDMDSSYAKVFLWSGFTSLQPLTEAKRIDIAR